MGGIFRTNDPTQFTDIDGVIIDEQTPPSQITGVSANVAIMLGQFQRGSTDLSLPLSSIGQFHENYGKSSYLGNKQLKNKAFGALRLIRVEASDAVLATLAHNSKITFNAKGGKGVYGNNLSVTIEDAEGDSSAVSQVETLTAVADVSSSLDGQGFILQDDAGSVAFWIDVGDTGTTIPGWASAADRAIEITTIAEDDANTVVAGKLATAINADSKFSASAVGSLVTITHTPAGLRDSIGTDGDDGGFTFALLTAGVAAVDAGVKYTFKDKNANSVLADEVYDNIKIAEITSATFVSSKIMNVTVTDASSGEPILLAETNLASGSDGTIANTDYETALEKAEVEGAGNVIFSDLNNPTINQYLRAHVGLTGDKMCILSGSVNDDVDNVVANVANYRDADGRIIYAWSWVETNIDGANEWTNPSAWVASAYTQVSPHVALSYVRNSRFFTGATDLRFKTGRQGHVALNKAGVLAFEVDSEAGITIRNAVTTHILNTQRREVIQRRMTDFLQDSLGKALKNWQNDVNSREKWDEIHSAVLAFDQLLVNDKVLPGEQDVQGGSPVLIDTVSLNTNDSVAQGIFKLLYKRRIFSSMRFIVLQAEIGTSVIVTESN